MNVLRIAAALGAAALFFASGPASAQVQPDRRVTQLIAQSGRSLGVNALQPHQTIRLQGSVSASGLKGTAVQYVDLQTGHFSESSNLPPVTQLDGYDGTAVWDGDGTKLVWNDGGDSDRSSEINQAYVATYALWKPRASDAAVTWVGAKSANGRAYDVLGVQPAGSQVPFDLWLDATTHLPARVVMQTGFTTSVTTYSDYQKFDGLNVPTQIHVDSSDGNNSDVTISSVAFDTPGAQAHIARPATRPDDFSILGGKTSTTVPMTLGENHVYLDVMLNGKGPYRFIFDTGGSNVVDGKVAQEIGAFGVGTAQGNGVGSQTESLSFANLSTLQVGDAVLKNQLFAVAPTRQGFGVSAGRQVDGLIGWEVLARFVTTFDYASGTVTLALPGTVQSQPGARVVPFVFYGTQPQVACTIDGIPAECTIDTGARDTISFMTPFAAAHPQVVPATLTAVGVDGFGFGGASLGKLGRLQTLSIGGFEFHDLVADYPAQTAGALTAPFVGANVGGNLLRRFTVTFDYGAQTMTLVPNAALAEPDFYERAGLFLINRGGTIAVVDARPGTPAAQAGIAKGDVIAAVDGVPTSTLTLGQIRDKFSQPAGTVVKLDVVSKDGTKRTVSLTLKDYV